MFFKMVNATIVPRKRINLGKENVCVIWMLCWVEIGYVSHRVALALAQISATIFIVALAFAVWLQHCHVHVAITLIFIKYCVEDE